MTATTGDPLEGTVVVRRSLALLPALAGVLATAVLVIGAVAAGVDDGGSSRILIGFGALAVLHAMAAGQIPGHYAGLALVTAAAMTGEPLTPARQAILVVALVLAHDIGRFSLDARLPTRFAPGLIPTLARRSALVMVLGLLIVALGPLVSDATPGLIAVPLALAALAAPLLLRRALHALPRDRRPSTNARLALGLAVGTAVVAIVLVGADARSAGIDRAVEETSTETTTTEGAEEAPVRPPPTEEPAGTLAEQLATIIGALLLFVVAGLFVAALRRPEVVFELDELDLDTEHRSIVVSLPAQAELDDAVAAIDERDYARLLEDLMLDIAGEPDPARAIRFGYVTVEQRLRSLGVDRRRSETEQELLARALPTLVADRAALAQLVALFEHARFGVSPVTEAMRTEAVEAVTALQASLAKPGREPTEHEARPAADGDPEPAS